MVQWEAELTELVTRRGGALVGYAYSLTRDKPQAEDLVQDALVKVYSRLRRPPRPGEARLDLGGSGTRSAEGYVRSAILTLYLDGYRRRNHWTGLKHLLADDARSPGADRVATARVDVGVALRRLSPRQREVVTLRFFEDLTVPQIATVLGTSPGTVKRHLFDATAVLREALAEVVVPAVETDLGERLGVVSGAVRRRRAAKVGAVAGASLVLAALLAFAAAWGPGRFLSEPVPPATPSPDAAVGGGWVPTGWRERGVQFHCGMEVTTLVSSSDVVELEITGDVSVVDDVEGDGSHLEAPIRITRSGAEGLPAAGGVPRLVFARDGQVVDIGPGWSEGGYGLPDAGASTDAVAEAGPSSACDRWTTDGVTGRESYRDQRPAGTYDVYAVTWWDEYAANGESHGGGLAVSEPVTMEVPAVPPNDELPLTVDIRDGYQPPWLEGTGLTCGAYASAIPGALQDINEQTGLDVNVDLTYQSATMHFQEATGEPFEATRTPFTTVWLSQGRVVAVGADVWSEQVEPLRVNAGGTTSITVPIGQPDPTCLADPGSGLPEGTYDMFVLAELDPGTGGERLFVTVRSDGNRYRP
ncbi:RNA polymerase sigma factor [Promicromonospora sp. NPDC050880]|uniref:RNA polymerase sigma factor n=1 Tax=Promicromonospora sp. NPDC050880 TaxID=3364406 RepID=UPI0037B87DC4